MPDPLHPNPTGNATAPWGGLGGVEAWGLGGNGAPHVSAGRRQGRQPLGASAPEVLGRGAWVLRWCFRTGVRTNVNLHNQEPPASAGGGTVSVAACAVRRCAGASAPRQEQTRVLTYRRAACVSTRFFTKRHQMLLWFSNRELVLPARRLLKNRRLVPLRPAPSFSSGRAGLVHCAIFLRWLKVRGSPLARKNAYSLLAWKRQTK